MGGGEGGEKMKFCSQICLIHTRFFSCGKGRGAQKFKKKEVGEIKVRSFFGGVGRGRRGEGPRRGDGVP